MNELVLTYNTNSGKYSLCAEEGILTDRVSYNTHIGLWVKLTKEGKYQRVNAFIGDQRVVTLQECECTKKTWKAITNLTKVIESFYE